MSIADPTINPRRGHTTMVFLPLLLSGVMYLLFRLSPPSIIAELRETVGYLPIKLSENWNWLVYNVPDGLWAFSFSNFLLIETAGTSRLVRFIYSAVGLTLMIGLECMQGVQFDGTFDKSDVVAILTGFVLSHFILLRKKDD